MGNLMNIYLDTNLWNVLCDRQVDPKELIASLAAKNASLVLSLQTFYELAKTFGSSTEKGLERGRELFSYFRNFIIAGTPCAKENMELLAAEMEALKSRTPKTDAFLNAEAYALLAQEVDKLANGQFDQRASEFIKNQREFALNTRWGQVRHLETRADTKRRLKKVTPENLKEWLRTETLSSVGIAILARHILRQFPDAPRVEVVEYASSLLVCAASRIARGLVRADLYYNWRCAHRESNPKDLIDDMKHVLNSTHCDVYATEEEKQAEYAGLLLTANTNVVIFNGDKPVEQWLAELACVRANRS